MQNSMTDPSFALMVYEGQASAAEDAIRSFQKNGCGYEILEKIQARKISVKQAASEIQNLIRGKTK